MKILFLGPTCLPIEKHLLDAGHSLVRTEDAIDIAFLRKHFFEFGISYRYKKIIKEDVISYFQGKLINLHISLLPWNRGADPNLWSHIENTPKGVTIHMIDVGIDTGDILLQQSVAINTANETLSTSYCLLNDRIIKLFLDNSDALLRGMLCPKKQEAVGSYHAAIDKVPYLSLLEKEQWDTPLTKLQNLS